MQKVAAMEKNRKLLPKFIVKEMESLFLEELRSSINLLMANLESLPVSKGTTDSKYGLRKFKRYNNSFRRSRRGTASSIKSDSGESSEAALTKLDVVLSFNVEVIVQEVQGVKSVQPTKLLYCTMEVEGGGEKLQTDRVEVSKAHWDTQGDFTITHPLTIVKVRLFVENSRMISMSDKELGKLLVKLTPNTNRTAEWCKMETPKNSPDHDVKIRLTMRMDRPQNLKCSGYLYVIGKHVWKKWKKRFMALVQVSQYTFAMCSYKEKKSDPTEMSTLDGYTVDYTEPVTDYDGGRFFFSITKEGETFMFASDDDNERHLWVQAMYRATGQAHKPQPPASIAATNNAKAPVNSPLSRIQGDADKARKHGMDEFIQADPCQFDHADLFKILQTLTLDYRLNDMFASLGWFNPGQIFVLDEYCARYGVRGCHRHLTYLDELLGRAEKGLAIDATLMHYSFAFCASHVHGNRPDGIGTVILAEKDKFDEIKDRLRNFLEYQITNFRFCFPMGRPEGALKASLSLVERVLMKDIVTPVPAEEVKSLIRKCLESAALVNYTKISAQNKSEDDAKHSTSHMANHHNDSHHHHQGSMDGQPLRKIEDILHIAELCIDLLQENQDFYAEEFKSAFDWFSDLLVEHSEIFWSLFAVDLEAVLSSQPPDTWNAFPVFQVLNDYLSNEPSMSGGKFHQQLKDMFAPLVVRYVDLMESSIAQSIHKGFEKETWKPHGHGCSSSEDMLWKLNALQTFISDLHWPDEVFAKHLEQRLKLMAADMIESCVKRTLEAYEGWMARSRKSTDFVIPSEVCVMINVVLHFKSEVPYSTH
ncbi:hypothetical protein RvY_06135-2 [Ramazzottius varieornatus]|uniref:PH domain-containing protein n=1 Tax=Ramazzottius varieornatus TaxID=947166 RepID=A0A1D1V122_RAMVA|nr:hypothetical protein RvY_06135-2 [Ramazzottius varieornatus]